MTSTIRSAGVADLARITEIYAHYVRTHTATFEIDAPGEEEMTKRWTVITGLGLPYLVSETAGVINGYAYASQYRPRPAYRFTVEDSIYIRPEMAGKGLGRALLAQLIEDCEAAGLRQMIAVVGDSANEPSIRLHTAFGFRKVGTLEGVGFKFGRWLDTVILQRPLIRE